MADPTPPDGDDDARADDVEAPEPEAEAAHPPAPMDQPAVDEVPVAGVHVNPPVPGMTAPGFGLTPHAPWAPMAPLAGGRPAPVAPAGWHPDPTGRHQYRWFDGVQWSIHVGDDGVASTDEGILG